jgi:cytosine/adenosine deaminase-related metal-dependent hydrolase
MLGQSIALTTPIDFLKQFEGLDKLSFAHCTRANKQELQQIKNLNATIIHCPNSNRLLNNDRLNLNFLDDIALSIGTDGLSSNYTLKIFDEIKDGFFMHYDIDTKQLAKKLLLSATNGGAKALGLQKGILKKDYDADIISFKIDDSGVVDSLPVAIILQDTKPTHIFIKGKDEINK